MLAMVLEIKRSGEEVLLEVVDEVLMVHVVEVLVVGEDAGPEVASERHGLEANAVEPPDQQQTQSEKSTGMKTWNKPYFPNV